MVSRASFDLAPAKDPASTVTAPSRNTTADDVTIRRKAVVPAYANSVLRPSLRQRPLGRVLQKRGFDVLRPFALGQDRVLGVFDDLTLGCCLRNGRYLAQPLTAAGRLQPGYTFRQLLPLGDIFSVEAQECVESVLVPVVDGIIGKP